MKDVAAVKPEHIERHISPKVTVGILNFLADVIQIDKENNETSEQKTKVKLKAREYRNTGATVKTKGAHPGESTQK